MMTVLRKNRNDPSDWKGWVLSITILIIAGLASGLSWLAVDLIKDMRKEFLTEFSSIRTTNNDQDKCITELKAHQNERLERERRNK